MSPVEAATRAPALPAFAFPQAVVFDMDGTLLDTERLAGRAWPLAARALGIAFDDALVQTMVGRNSRDCAVLIAERHGDAYPVDALMQAMREAYDGLVAREGIAVKDGAHELIDWLAMQRVPMAVATSTRRARAKAKLADAGLLPRFAEVTGGDEVQRGKPAPDSYLLAAARLGVDPAACLAVEDSEPGYVAAAAAGMHVAYVPDQAPPSRALLARNPRLFDTLSHLHRWLREAADAAAPMR
jgi:HAD superfamily hydrolase (TIGR01509 family)